MMEAHIVARLGGKTPPEGWPGILPINVVGRFSQMIGAVLPHGANVRKRDLDAHRPAAAGFKVLMNGLDGFRDVLDGLRQVSGLDVVSHASCYGALMQWFRTGAGSEASYGPLRDILRDHIVNGWPLEAGTVDLDVTLPDRLWHTVASAEDEYGVVRLRTDEVATHLRHIEDIKWLGLGATGRQLRIGAVATLALIKHGYLSAKEEAQDGISVTVTVVDPATIADFSQAYVSLHALAHEIKMDVSEVQETLVGEGINPIADMTAWVMDFLSVGVPRPFGIKG